MSQARKTWDTYASTWNAPAEQRQALFEASLETDCVYTDPTIQTEGWEQLQAYMDGFQQQVPGGHFVTHEFHSHHGRSIAKWTMRSGDGTTIGEGISYGQYSGSGKLVAMTGFFETAD